MWFKLPLWMHIVNKKHFGEPIFVTLPKEIILVFSWNLFKSSFYIFFMTNLSWKYGNTFYIVCKEKKKVIKIKKNTFCWVKTNYDLGYFPLFQKLYIRVYFPVYRSVVCTLYLGSFNRKIMKNKIIYVIK